MQFNVSRRRLLAASIAGLPLLAACGDDAAPSERGSAASSPAPSPVVEADAPAPAAAAGGIEAAVPQASAEAQPTPPEPAPAARVRTIVLDPGHGAEEIGAASAIAGLPNLLEKDSNLAFGYRLRELLQMDGFRVVMTRESDSRATGYAPPDAAMINAAGGNATLTTSRSDLQTRVDFANENQGDLFLSLHSNDSGSLAENGVEVWYCADRENGPENGVFAQIMLETVLDGLRGYGYRATNRGTKEDRYFRVRNDRNFHLFVLGPPNPEARHPRATMMPAALIENLFMRHERDQWVLRDPAARETITQSMRLGINRFFEWRGA